MHALVIKTSSLGDVIHTFPAITDVSRERPEVQIEWLVEEDFVEVPTWHPFVRKAIPVSLRRWRRNIARDLFSNEIAHFRAELRERSYDIVIDAQGLIKSALLGFVSRGPVHGFARDCVREPAAALLYSKGHPVAWGQHAITRLRQLFARVFDYPVPTLEPDYGLDSRHFFTPGGPAYVVFLHGTNWVSKHWPEVYWSRLAVLAVESGYEVRLPWGSSDEHARAKRVAAGCPGGVRVLPRTSLSDLAAELVNATGVVGVDSGLIHLAAAFAVPGVTLYGATDPRLTGTRGKNQTVYKAEFPCSPCLNRRCALEDTAQVYPPCYEQLSPEAVWGELLELMDK